MDDWDVALVSDQYNMYKGLFDASVSHGASLLRRLGAPSNYIAEFTAYHERVTPRNPSGGLLDYPEDWPHGTPYEIADFLSGEALDDDHPWNLPVIHQTVLHQYEVGGVDPDNVKPLDPLFGDVFTRDTRRDRLPTINPIAHSTMSRNPQVARRTRAQVATLTWMYGYPCTIDHLRALQQGDQAFLAVVIARANCVHLNAILQNKVAGRDFSQQMRRKVLVDTRRAEAVRKLGKRHC